jgi:hypothetical protein
VAAAVAKLAQLLVRLSRTPTVLLGTSGSLSRIGPRLPPVPRRECPSPPSKEQFGCALQIAGESRVSLPMLGQVDRETRALLIE